MFLDNFLARCEARGESPTHALESAGLSKSCLSKWRKYPDRVPAGDTVLQLANYFGYSLTGKRQQMWGNHDLYAVGFGSHHPLQYYRAFQPREQARE